MPKIVLMLFLLFAFPVMGCQITSQQIIGGYVFLDGDTVLEAFELNEDHTYTSWLHNRPESEGKWKREKCTITVEIESHPSPIKFELVSVTENEMVIIFDGLSRAAKFKKIE